MTDPQNNRPTGHSLVRAHDLRKSFNGKEILKGLSVEFAPHRTTVVLGPSGCGKSVMLKHLVGLLRPDSGEVHFDDIRIDTMPEKKMTPIRRQFGFLFQMGALFDSLNVRMNIEFPLVESGVSDPEERLLRVREVLSMVGLADEAERWLGKPVIAINTATWWMALRENGIEDKVYGCGRLMREF